MLFTAKLPERIICLTEETTEILYLLGMQHLIVGISEYTVRPPIAPLEKPKVSRFIDSDIEQIIDLKPDVVFAWSDLQADISAQLIRQGIEVYNFNHRSIDGILANILKVGSIVGKHNEANDLCNTYISKLQSIQARTSLYKIKPKVYFEEWFQPLITPIKWVSQIIEICGGLEIFKENSDSIGAKGRILENSDEVIVRSPDIIFASWCGKPFRKKTMLKRKGWDTIPAIINDEVYEVGSDIILQPGPAALSDGIDFIDRVIGSWVERK